MLKNGYLDAKIGVDTAENEPKGKSDVTLMQALLESQPALRADLADAARFEERAAALVQKAFALESLEAGRRRFLHDSCDDLSVFAEFSKNNYFKRTNDAFWDSKWVLAK